ncbi:MAG: hypothetical protein LC664_05690 [Flavobacteriales bacterium]|nr:hypothetical protein [Flavobacteriales bacterium]
MKKLLKYVIAVFVLLIIGGIGAFYLAKAYEPQVRDVVVKQLNEFLAVEVSVEDINFSFTQKFPYASLRFSNVVIPEVIDGKQQADTLLYVEDLYLQIGLLDFLKKDYRVTEADLNNGFFRMKYFENGTDNFQFWKTKEGEGKSQNLTINDFEIADFKFELSRKSDLDLSLDIKHAEALGDFGADQFEVSLTTDLTADEINSNGEIFYASERISGDLELLVDKKADTYKFRGEKLVVAGQSYKINGEFSRINDNPEWDLKLLSEKADLRDALHLLPLPSRNKFSDYAFSGSTGLNVSLKSGKNFSLDANFSKLKGDFKHKLALGRATFRDTEGKIEVRNSISSLFLDKIDCTIGPGKLSAWGKIVNFNQPSFDLHIKGLADLSELRSLLNMKSLEILRGRVNLDGRLTGRIPVNGNAQTTAFLKGVDFLGKIELEDGAVKMAGRNESIDRVSGNIQLANNSIIVESGKAQLNENPFELSGTIFNALPYLSSKDQNLKIEANFKSDLLDLNKILTESESTADSSYHFALPKNVSFDLMVDIGKIAFRRFKAEDISGRAYYKLGVLSLNPFTFKTASGKVASNTSISARGSDYEIISMASLRDIDLKELFYEFENFSQQVVGAENLEGRANADLQFTGNLSENMVFDNKSITADAELTVWNGKLIELESLQSIPDYLRKSALWNSLIKVNAFEKELKVVKFDTLKNRITIANETVSIPAMTVNSSAMRLNISGTHSFEHHINYGISFRLSELLRTGKETSSEFGYVVDDGTGLNLFLKMTGTAQNPVFGMDKDAARSKRQNQLEEEKTTFKRILKEEFGMFKKDSTLTPVDAENRHKPVISVDMGGMDTKSDSASQKNKPTKKTKKLSKEDEDLYKELEDDDDL